jgi:SAM-dependent methyltransferase
MGTKPENQRTSKPERPTTAHRAPDNRASWNAISDGYQQELGWPAERLAWGVFGPFEDELLVLGDIAGAHALVLGCGGGQDLVALARLGAAKLTGVDISDRQLEHARDLLLREDVLSRTRLIRSSAEDLSVIRDASVDVTVSVHALNYVERADLCFRETYRVLAPGGVFGLSVQHPADASTRDEPPFEWEKPYFQQQRDWQWTGLNSETSFRSYYRTIAGWFALLTDAGFRVERLLEPQRSSAEYWMSTGWGRLGDWKKYETVPGIVVFGARKEGER